MSEGTAPTSWATSAGAATWGPSASMHPSTPLTRSANLGTQEPGLSTGPYPGTASSPQGQEREGGSLTPATQEVWGSAPRTGHRDGESRFRRAAGRSHRVL